MEKPKQLKVYPVDLDKHAEELRMPPTEELEKIRWFSVDAMAGVKLTPPSVKLFKKMGLP